ncbi:hypothetical protein BH11PSE6_BH11PSE6_03790 [soil metagenome]
MTATIHPLRHPITYSVGDEKITLTELKLRRPTAQDLLLIDEFQNQPMKLVLEMIAQLSGEMRLVIGKVDAEDLGPLADIAFANVEGGPKTGATASAS